MILKYYLNLFNTFLNQTYNKKGFYFKNKGIFMFNDMQVSIRTDLIKKKMY